MRTTTDQVAGGCFCCRSDEFASIIQRQRAESRPSIILAEPVGSCTDLQATLINPLREVYRLPLTIAPLIVVVDGRRAVNHFLGTKRSAGLVKEVGYIWPKQLEDAEVIVINKVDLLSESRLTRLQQRMRQAFPSKPQLLTSAVNGSGIEALMQISQRASAGDVPDVDYDLYASGEAALGWLHMEADVSAKREFAPDRLLLSLAEAIRSELEAAGADIAHFKMSFSPPGLMGLSVVNVSMNGDKAKISTSDARPTKLGKLLVNLRAIGDPASFETMLREAPGRLIEGINANWTRCDAFRPSAPKPLHRLSATIASK